jgi:transposase
VTSAQAKKKIERLTQQVLERDEIIRKQAEVIRQLEARILELERRLGMNSKNSNRPPSSDAPWEKAAVAEGCSLKTTVRGARSHRGAYRELVDDPDVVIIEYPTTCESCGAFLPEERCRKTHRHQVIEVPRVKATVTEYQFEAVRCPCCDHVTRATFPSGVSASPFGPNVVSLVNLLVGQYRMSQGLVQLYLAQVYQLTLSRSAIAACLRRMSEAVAPVHEEALGYVQKAHAKHADETPWYQHFKLSWLWVGCAGPISAFLIQAHRSTDCAKRLLGETVTGILGSDRLACYGFVPLTQRQACWAHLRRVFVAFSEATEVTRYIGDNGLIALKKLYGLWHQREEGTLAQSAFREAISPVQHELLSLLELGTEASEPKTRSACQGILDMGPALWTFIDHPEIPPDNNRAERDLRPAVILRKLSLGTRSDEGSRFMERMLTVLVSLRHQSRCVLTFLNQAYLASLYGRAPPSLVPTSAI